MAKKRNERGKLEFRRVQHFRLSRKQCAKIRRRILARRHLGEGGTNEKRTIRVSSRRSESETPLRRLDAISPLLLSVWLSREEGRIVNTRVIARREERTRKRPFLFSDLISLSAPTYASSPPQLLRYPFSPLRCPLFLFSFPPLARSARGLFCFSSNRAFFLILLPFQFSSKHVRIVFSPLPFPLLSHFSTPFVHFCFPFPPRAFFSSDFLCTLFALKAERKEDEGRGGRRLGRTAAKAES